MREGRRYNVQEKEERREEGRREGVRKGGREGILYAMMFGLLLPGCSSVSCDPSTSSPSLHVALPEMVAESVGGPNTVQLHSTVPTAFNTDHPG